MTTEQRAGLTDLLRYAAERTDREDIPQTSEDTSVFFDGARWATARLRAIADEVGSPADGWNDERLTALVNACHDEVRQELLGTELNPSTLAEDAAAYGRLRDAIAATMDDPDRWDGDASEDEILAQYVKWLADGKPALDDDEAFRPGGREEIILAEVQAERTRQDAKWGPQNHPDGTGWKPFGAAAQHWKDVCDEAAEGGHTTWAPILLEEAFEACEEADPAKLRAELVQVAAVAVAWIGAIDRRTSEGGKRP